jgi:hypothetical protein
MALYRTIPGPPKETAFTDEQLGRYLAEVRREALLEVARAVCWRCKAGNPVRLGVPYDDINMFARYCHPTKGRHVLLMRCNASVVHEMLAADQPNPDQLREEG